MNSQHLVNKLLEADELDAERYLDELADIGKAARDFGLGRSDSGEGWLKPYRFHEGERMVVMLNIGVPYLQGEEKKVEYNLTVVCFPRTYYRVKGYGPTMQVGNLLRRFLRDITRLFDEQYDFDITAYELGRLAANHGAVVALS